MPVPNNIDNIGSSIIPFSLKGTDEQRYSPDDFKDKEVIVIIFMCNHCPYVKAVAGRLARLYDKLKSRGVQFIGINSNDPAVYEEDSFEHMKGFAEEYGLSFPYVVDDTQETAKAYEAVCTPDIYVYDRNRILRYRGRLDDSWKDESMVKSNDLEKAINLVVERKEIDFEQIPSMGCSIKWKYK